MERKTLGILALALVGLMAVSLVAAMPFTTEENHEAIRDAVQAGDYDAWKSLRMAELSEENFEKMTQIHELKEQVREAREAGDDATVEALMEDLKELMPEGRGMGHGKMGSGRGFGKGMRQGGHEDCLFVE